MMASVKSKPTPGDEVLWNLPVPQPDDVSTNEADKILVEWQKVQVDPENPILGVKIKLWEVKGVTEDAANDEGSGLNPPKETPVPSYPPAITATAPADATSAKLANVKPEVDYWLSLQTFNDQGEGPYSPVLRILIHHPKLPDMSLSVPYIKFLSE